ncbi:hypothetical protein [Streptomyces collinus]|uniref:hypothetical protein n=1 Tax=Streptomyces collinus TaxID=42684 RepID=UPI003446BF54
MAGGRPHGQRRLVRVLPVGAAAFLASVYGRTIDVPGMPGNFPGDDPQVLGLSG